ncbi:MAG: RsmE family RNA methyltransferase, partial [Candidatus Sumerlaeia bacterium]|nr:RsmE family RNA methyltransferase [Candidatus Sumerlaeia bacterium]
RKYTRVKIIEETIPTADEAKIAINLAIPLTNQEKIELIVEKATELGVNTIYLFQSLRTRSHYPVASLSERKLERLKTKVIAGAKQCGRAYLPEIKADLTLNEIIQQFTEKTACLKLMPWEKVSAPLLSQILHSITPDNFTEAIVIIGPEGGFSENEAHAGEQAGFQLCSLGNRILRLETASFASLTLILSAFKEI